MNRLTVIVISILALPILLAPLMVLRAGRRSRGPTVDTFGPILDGGTGGVSVDASGNVYVADFGAILGDTATMGRAVFRVTPAGQATRWATGFQGASGNVFDTQGNLYQSNIRGNFISRIRPDGRWEEYARDGIEGPVGLVFDDTGDLFVANCGNHTIQRVSPNGDSRVFASDSLLRCPNGLTFDASHNLYVANFDNGDVLKVTPDAEVTLLATMPGGNNGHLIFHDGFLYVVDRGAHQIQQVALDGTVQTFAGTGQRGHENGPALQATFSFPNDIAAAHDGSAFYVNEMYSTTDDPTQLEPMMVRRIQLPPR